jgi:FtsP/CotA-like multicopper oxidase with cupredoxin domain
MGKVNIPLLVIIAAVIVVGGGLFLTGDKEEVSENNVQNLQVATQPAKPLATQEISRHASDIPPPITRIENETVSVTLDAVQLVGEIDDGITYEYWTFNNTVPGPFIRVMEGDTVKINLTHSHDHTAYNDSEEDLEAFFDSFKISGYIPTAYAQGHEHAPGTPDDHGHGSGTFGIHAMPDGTVMTGSGEVLSDAVLLPDGNRRWGGDDGRGAHSCRSW